MVKICEMARAISFAVIGGALATGRSGQRRLRSGVMEILASSAMAVWHAVRQGNMGGIEDVEVEKCEY